MEGSFMILTAAFVFYVIFWLSKQVSSSKELQDKTLGASEKKWGVFWLVYFTVLREGFETILMLMPSETMEGEAYFYLKFLFDPVFFPTYQDQFVKTRFPCICSKMR